MKLSREIKNLGLVLTISLFVSVSVFAQNATPSPTPQKRDRITGNPKVETKTTETGETTKMEATKSDPPKTDVTPTPETTPGIKQTPDAAKKEETSETKTEPVTTEKTEATPSETPTDDPAAQVVSYYINYVKEYRLGPEDVISVEVFGQPNYSKAGITIPPTATISYPLIPGGVFVSGKSTDQISVEIARKLSEYIIDPKVTVTLEKVGSARYAVMGDVAQPGIRLMTRRVTAMTAVTEAGGILTTGNKSKVIIYRSSGQGAISQVPVNIDAILKGKEKDVDLQPGDQLFIPGNKMKTFLGVIDTVSKLSSFRLLFGSPF